MPGKNLAERDLAETICDRAGQYHRDLIRDNNGTLGNNTASVLSEEPLELNKDEV